MPRPCTSTIWLGGLLAVILTGCAGYSTAPAASDAAASPTVAPAATAAGLPAPAALRTASDVTTRLLRWGEDYTTGLANPRATRAGTAARFSPDWAGTGADLSGLAWAAYEFNVTDYTGPALINFEWVQAADYADCWVALADWTQDRWAWSALDPANTLAYDPTRHVDGGNRIVLVVLAKGRAEWLLHAVYIDRSTGPAWPVFGGDLQRTRQSPQIGPVSPNELWRVTGGDHYYDPVISPDGTIVVSHGDGWVRAYWGEGQLKWEYLTTEDIFITASPAIGPDGTVYIGTWDKYFYAINPDGTLKWKFETGGFIESSAMVDANGRVYFGSNDNNVYALNPDMSVAWTFPTGGTVYSGPTFGPTGNLYFGSLDGKLYCVNADGEYQWDYPTGKAIWGAPAVADDGTVYFGGMDENVYALHADGSFHWSYPTSGWVWGSAALCLDGSIVIGSDDYSFHCITADGDLKWTFPAGVRARHSATVGGDGTVYLTGYDDGTLTPAAGNYLFALDPADGSVDWYFAEGSGCPSLGPDGTLYAFLAGEGGLAALGL